MSHVSQKNLDMIGTLAEELEAIADLAALRKALVRKAGAGYETYSNEALIEELDRRAKDSAAEARRERKVATDRSEEIRRLELQVQAAFQKRWEQTFSIPGIPDSVTRVRAVEDHAEVFERVASGIYKGLWKNTRSGGYYDTVELLTLTDVEAF